MVGLELAGRLVATVGARLGPRLDVVVAVVVDLVEFDGRPQGDIPDEAGGNQVA